MSCRCRRVSLPVAWARLRIHLSVWWPLLIMKFVPSEQGRKRIIVQSAAWHSPCLGLRFFWGLLNMLDECRTGRSLPFFCFWNKKQHTGRWHASLSSVNFPFRFGSVSPGSQINSFSETWTAFSAFFLIGPDTFSCLFLCHSERICAFLAKLGSNQLGHCIVLRMRVGRWLL